MNPQVPIPQASGSGTQVQLQSPEKKVTTGPLPMNIFNMNLDTDVPLASLEDYYGPGMVYTRSYEEMAYEALEKLPGRYYLDNIRDDNTGYTIGYQCKLWIPNPNDPEVMIREDISMLVDPAISPVTVRCQIFKRMLQIIREKHPNIVEFEVV